MIPAQSITPPPPCWHHSLVGTWWPSTNHIEVHPPRPSSVVWHQLMNKTVWKCVFIYFWAHCNPFSLWALVKGGRNTAVCTSANLWRVLHREAPLASNTCLLNISGYLYKPIYALNHTQSFPIQWFLHCLYWTYYLPYDAYQVFFYFLPFIILFIFYIIFSFGCCDTNISKFSGQMKTSWSPWMFCEISSVLMMLHYCTLFICRKIFLFPYIAWNLWLA